MKGNKKIFLTSAVLLLILVSSTASAATLKVGSKAQYKTIQSAVDAAKDGDTIKVASGTYNERVHVNKGVSLIGTGYPKVDFIGDDVNSGGARDNTLRIEGFKLEKEGIHIGPDCATNYIIKNNKLYNCGIRFFIHSGQNIRIENNEIKKADKAISASDCPGGTIIKNTISDSKYGLALNDCDLPTLSKNKFKNCDTAIVFYKKMSPDFDITNNKFINDNKFISNQVNLQIESPR